MKTAPYLRKIVLWNGLLILGVGLYGALTEEQYWRAVGHWLYLYDYLFWLTLALNGPSGFLSERLSQLIHPQSHPLEWGYVAQYGFWLLLLPMQWRFYFAIAAWCRRERRRTVALFMITACITVLGCLATYEAWMRTQGWPPYFRYHWPMLYASLTLTGLVLLSFRRLLTS
jgi:hypothetical protein